MIGNITEYFQKENIKWKAFYGGNLTQDLANINISVYMYIYIYI